MFTDRLERWIRSHQEALADIGNLPNRTGSCDYDPQLPLHLRQREPQGLDDFFVMKHTTDNTLSRYLLSKHGFATPDHESPTENINPQVASRWIQQAHSPTHCHRLFTCSHCGEIIGLTPPL